MQYKNNFSRYAKRIINKLPGHVWWKDYDLIYLGCNEKVLEFLGFPSENDFIGKTDYQLWEKEIAKKLEEADLKILKTGKSISLEEVIVRYDGKKSIMLTNKSPLYDEKGNIIGIIGTSTDVTERKMLEEKIVEEKVKHFKTLSAIGGMMAHELRTPLASIALSASTIKEFFPVLLEVYQEYSKITGTKKIRKGYLNVLEKIADNIEVSAGYASNTINTILAGFHYSTSETFPLEEIEINAVIQKALNDYPLTKEERALITFHPTSEYKLLASPNVIIHVVHNLLKNALYAIQAANKGEITISVEKIKNGFLEIKFKDTAKGIPENIRQHIFEPFYTTKDSDTSIGLGLYFCKMALEKMHASIACESKVGEYALFIIQLNGLSSQKK